jgi:hypothetical protein
MIWFFTRGRAQVNIEVRRGAEPATFELVVDYPDGSERVARFSDARKLVRYALKVQRRFIRDGWIPSPPAERARPPLTELQAAAAPRPRLWSRVQRRLSARWAATFGL